MVDTTLERFMTAADHENFIAEGFVFLRGVIPPEVCEEAVEILARAGSGLLATKNYDRETGAMTQQIVAKCCTFVTAPAAELIASPSNPAPELTSFGQYVPKPPTPGIEWDAPYPHTDMAHPTFLPEQEKLNAFIFLSKVESHGGAFTYSPGSPNRFRSFMSRNTFESVHSRARNPEIGGQVVECLAEPGDVILYQSSMVHTGSLNVTGPPRYAIRAGVSFPGRLIVAGKDSAEMSTLEKAVSVRYLRDRFGQDFRPLEPPPAADLSEGFGPVAAHDLLRFDGETHRFWVDPASPSVIRRQVSHDLVDWMDIPSLDLGPEAVVGLHTEYRFDPTLTVVTKDGEGRTKSRTFESPDLEDWDEVFGLEGAVVSRPHFIIEFALDSMFAREARGECVYFVRDDEPGVIRWKAGESRASFENWAEGVAHTTHGTVTDILVRPGRGAFEPVLIADVDGEARYTISNLSDAFEGPLNPVTSDVGTPTQIRLIERAEGYWFVTYRVDDRVHFGEIDWHARPGHVLDLPDADALRRGLATIGLT